MEHLKIKNNPLLLFFALVLAASAVVEALIVTKEIGILYLILMWIPALAAFAANLRKRKLSAEKTNLPGFLRDIGFRGCKVRYILIGCLLPMVYLLIPYLIYWKTHPENFAYSGAAVSVILKDLAPVTVIGIFGSLLSAVGEEIGWRGFMVPELYKKLGLHKTLLISSLFWCCWHLPLLIFGDYMDGTPLWYKVPAFILCIFPVGVMAGLLAIRTGSVWPSAFLHAAHNNYDQAVFDVITRGEDRMYYVSETGVLTILCAWIIAAIMLVILKKTGRRSASASGAME